MKGSPVFCLPLTCSSEDSRQKDLTLERDRVGESGGPGGLESQGQGLGGRFETEVSATLYLPSVPFKLAPRRSCVITALTSCNRPLAGACNNSILFLLFFCLSVHYLNASLICFQEPGGHLIPPWQRRSKYLHLLDT